MQFTETRFPTDISYGSCGGAEYNTDIVIINECEENRHSNWEKCRLRFNIAPGIKTQSQLTTLIAFFRARKGRAEGFRFKDWTDYSAHNERATQLSATTFQLVKFYPGNEERRVIKKPVSGTVTVYVNGIERKSGVVVDYNQGLILFDKAIPPELKVTADFEFDVPVRFDTDRLSATLDSYGSFSRGAIPLIEIMN